MDNAKTDLAIPVDVRDHSLGHPHAGVVLVEYGDFECPICKQAAPLLKALLRRFPLQLKLIFRHYPLTEVHPHALEAALSAETAGAQRKFWSMHDLLLDNQAHLKTAYLRRYAERLKLDMTRYDMEMADTVYLQRVREHIDGGMRSGVRATPGFFLDGRRVDASFGLELIVREVEAAVLACGPISNA